jgi:excisionase family DNA binding protein
MSKLTVKEFAEKVNLTRGRIVQMINEGEIRANKIGDIYIIDQKFVQTIKTRPERRGRKRKMEVAI